MVDREHSVSPVLALVSAAERRRERQLQNRWRSVGAVIGGALGFAILGAWPSTARLGALAPLAAALLGFLVGAIASTWYTARHRPASPAHRRWPAWKWAGLVLLVALAALALVWAAPQVAAVTHLDSIR